MKLLCWIILCITIHQCKRTEGQEEAHDTSCGIVMALPDGDSTLTSKGYPDGYDLNTKCTWMLDTASVYNKNQTVRLNFVNVDIANTTDCSSEHIKIYSVTTSDGDEDPLAKICGKGGRTFEFYIKSLNIAFKTGGEQAGMGFKLLIQSRNVSSCNKRFTAGTVTHYMTSENYPSPFPSFQRCTYLIEANRKHMNVKFIVSVSELEYTCKDEYVLVFDGKNENSPLLGKWCGTSRPTYKSLRGSLYIVFVSKDNSYTKRRGFRALYKEEMCGEKFNIVVPGHSRRIAFPPSLYKTFKDGIRCVWTLKASSVKEKVFVYFTNTNLTCGKHIIAVVEEGGSKTLICGSKDRLFVSDYRSLVIKLRTDVNLRSPAEPVAFSLQFWSGRTDGCDGPPESLTAHHDQRKVESPGYPFRYPNLANCVWEIVSLSFSKKVKVMVGKNELNPDGCQDFIAFYNARAHRFSGHEPAMKLCGGKFDTFISTKDHATIKFHTNSDDQGKGFVLYYQSYTPEDDAGGNSYTLLTGILGVLAAIVVIGLCVCICVGRKRCRSSSPDPAFSNDASGEPVTPFLVANPASDTTPVTTSAPPPSYQELSSTPVQNDHLAAEPSAPCLPPPSYEDAVSKGMLIAADTGL